MDFMTLPMGPITLKNVTVPAAILGQSGDLIRTDIGIADGKIAAPGGTYLEMQRATVLSVSVDCHMLLDKPHLLPRPPNPTDSFLGPLKPALGYHPICTSDAV